MTALGEKNECITLVSVNNSKTSTRPGDSFVDDKTTCVTCDNTTMELFSIDENELTEDEVELIEQMQVAIQFFLDLLQVTGVLLQRNTCGTLSRTGGKRVCEITSKKSETPRDRNHIKCNRSNNRNQKKGGESGTPHFRVSSDI
jgi:hypothetical protein